MLRTQNNKIIKKLLHSFYEEVTYELPKRLRGINYIKPFNLFKNWNFVGTFEFVKTFGEKNYVKPFNVFKNWNLVRTFATNRYKLISDYIHLIEEEQFDEH